jgi:hypothetical protein
MDNSALTHGLDRVLRSGGADAMDKRLTKNLWSVYATNP